MQPLTANTEVADNTYRDGSSELNNTEASFVEDGGVSVDQRKMNAVRAYFEWIPLRQVEMGDDVSFEPFHIPFIKFLPCSSSASGETSKSATSST
jgi:hypothetical protein